jgi:hypothetical protein
MKILPRNDPLVSHIYANDFISQDFNDEVEDIYGDAVLISIY